MPLIFSLPALHLMLQIVRTMMRIVVVIHRGRKGGDAVCRWMVRKLPPVAMPVMMLVRGMRRRLLLMMILMSRRRRRRRRRVRRRILMMILMRVLVILRMKILRMRVSGESGAGGHAKLDELKRIIT